MVLKKSREHPREKNIALRRKNPVKPVKAPQHERLKALFAEWERETEDIPPAEWWDDLDHILGQLRVKVRDSKGDNEN